jgi:glycosyltransferase involved in cell wall biosynthesis
MIRHLAYASPINPVPSGISDYSEELLPYLGRYADITLYVDDRLRPTNPQLARHLTIRPLSKLARDHRRRPYDAILYQIGNSFAHASIWQALQRTPGIVVLHEVVLHHFMLQYYANVLGDIDRYRSEAGRRYGPEGDRIANLMMHGRFTEAAFDLPFCEDVLDRADGLIAHSQYVLDRAATLRQDLPAALVPMGVPLPHAIDQTAARTRLGLPLHAPILASFGHINPYKRIDATLRALRVLQTDYPELRYILVGSASPSYDVRAAVARAGMQEMVTITGYVERNTFEDYVAAADLCINLRHPTAGETSASLLRLLGAGRPTLITASGSFMEIPPGAAAHVDPDANEGDLIQAYIRLLLQRPDLAKQVGTAARAYVAKQHTLDGAALGYMRFLSTRYGWNEPQPQRPPLWEIEPSAISHQPSAISRIRKSIH